MNRHDRRAAQARRETMERRPRPTMTMRTTPLEARISETKAKKQDVLDAMIAMWEHARKAERAGLWEGSYDSFASLLRETGIDVAEYRAYCAEADKSGSQQAADGIFMGRIAVLRLTHTGQAYPA